MAETTETTPTTETDPPPAKPAASTETVSREDHERALADMHKFKKEATELKAREKTAADEKLKAESKWKELAEAKEKEASDAKTESERLRTSYVDEKKFSAVHAKALALGLRPEAASDLEMLDLAQIQVETTSTGKINILGADKFAERLKTLKPHWFDKPKPKVNGGNSKVLDSSDPISAQDVMAAEKEGRKSGDMTKYQETFKKFQQQRAAARSG